MTQTTHCPVCLYPPVAPQVTRALKVSYVTVTCPTFVSAKQGHYCYSSTPIFTITPHNSIIPCYYPLFPITLHYSSLIPVTPHNSITTHYPPPLPITPHPPIIPNNSPSLTITPHYSLSLPITSPLRRQPPLHLSGDPVRPHLLLPLHPALPGALRQEVEDLPHL